MRKLLIALLFFVFIAGIRNAWCQDNLLAVDVIAKPLPKDENTNNAEVPMDEVKPPDDFEQGLKEIKAYREVLENKQKELEIIKLDLEKSSLLLKKKETEKEIYQIDKALPRGRAEDSSLDSPFIQGVKEPVIDSSDIKIQLLLIADNVKEGQVSLKGALYSFKEGDTIASKLTVHHIETSGVTFKQPDGSILKINFLN